MTKLTTPARKGKATPAAATKAAPNPLKVNPPAGWVRQSAYGTLKDERNNPLVRLEDVHALLMERAGLTSAEAASRVFGPFVSDSNSKLGMQHGVAALQSHLCIVDPSEKAYSVGSFSGRVQLERIAGQLPHVPHHHFDRGTPEAFYYALGLVAGEVWAPSSGIADLQERLGGYGADEPFPTTEQARAILGPFAVRHELAYHLWSWGSNAEVQAATDAGDSVQPKQPNDWKAPGAKQRLQDEVGAYNLKHRRGGRADAARRYGVRPSRITELLKDYAAEQEAAKPLAATFATGLGERTGKKAA